MFCCSSVFSALYIYYFCIFCSLFIPHAVICVLDRKLIELGTGRGSYASLSIAKFIDLSERCFVVGFFSFVCILVSNILLVYYSMGTTYVNIRILQ